MLELTKNLQLDKLSLVPSPHPLAMKEGLVNLGSFLDLLRHWNEILIVITVNL